MGETDVRETLNSFGLSEKEVDAYLAVLERGEATTRTVSTAADVSQSYVYDIATALADRGLVTVDETTTPTTIRARPPAEAVDALSVRLSSFEESIEDVYSGPTHSESAFEVIHSHQTVRRRARRYLTEATDEIFAIVPAGSFSRVADELAAAVERDVFVYLLLASPDVESVYGEIDDPGTYAHVVRTWDSRPPLFALADEDAGVLASYGMLEGPHTDDYALAFGQDEVASGFYGNYLSNVWPMAQERFVAEPPELPASYEEFRTGVTVAAMHAAADNEVVADIEGTDVETGRAVTLENARVREARQNLVEPANNAFPIENSLVVETDDGLASVGGQTGGLGPYYEGYAADSVTLRRA